MKLSRVLLVACMLSLVLASFSSARSLLERRVQYQKAENGKVVEAKYWYVFLGSQECTLQRKYPGEEMGPVTGAMNFSLLSSGYIEGNGYSAKGKLECLPSMMIRTEAGGRKIHIDSIDCIYENGRKVLLTNGERGDFLIDVEGQTVVPKRFELTEYKMTVVYGEKKLQKSSDDIKITALAIGRGGLQRAREK